MRAQVMSWVVLLTVLVGLGWFSHWLEKNAPVMDEDE